MGGIGFPAGGKGGRGDKDTDSISPRPPLSRDYLHKDEVNEIRFDILLFITFTTHSSDMTSLCSVIAVTFRDYKALKAYGFIKPPSREQGSCSVTDLKSLSVCPSSPVVVRLEAASVSVRCDNR